MWEVKNETPFAADRVITIDQKGRRAWVVVVRATFDVSASGELEVSEEQGPPTVGPEYVGEDGASSLLYEQDLQHAKPRTDVYLNASACSPSGRPVTEVPVALRMPWGEKQLLVRGDRTWTRSLVGSLETTSPLPFLEMPIVYERAYGGFDTQAADPGEHRLHPENPIGTGFFTRASHRSGKLLPNILPVSGTMDVTCGYGAVCSYWHPRLEYQGTYDATWIKEHRPLLPPDYDSRVLQCAPADQQAPAYLRGGEKFAVVHMNASRPVIEFALPKRYFAFRTAIGQQRREHRASLTTVVIEPSWPRVIITWHSTLECHGDVDDIDYTLITEKRYV